MLGNMVQSGELTVTEQDVHGGFKPLFLFSGCQFYPYQTKLPHILVLSFKYSLCQNVTEMGADGRI